MNNQPRWINLIVVYVVILTFAMILLYVINQWLAMEWGLLWVIGVFGSGLLAYQISDKIF